MYVLALKLVVTPALIGVASLAERRWGPAVSGWLIGLPFTSGPATFFLAITQGARFAAAAAVDTLTGAIAQAVFCLTYAWFGRRYGWPGALAAACAGFAGTTVIFQAAALALAPITPLVLLTLLLAPRLMPREVQALQPGATPPRWDLPARMLIATSFVPTHHATGSVLPLAPVYQAS